MTTFRTSLFIVAATFAATSALAQDSRVAVSGGAGAAAGSADTGLAVGAAVLVDAHERIALEAQGAFLRRGEGADALAVGGSVLLNLLPTGRPIVPYVAAGGGLYHVSFDLDRPRFLGPTGPQFAAGATVCAAPGTGFGPGGGPGFGSGTCPASAAGYWGVGALPRFYASRLGPLAFPRGAAWGTRSFTDPAVSLGGGLRFDVNDRLMIRPDARAIIVFADGDTHTLGVFLVHVGYRF
jgi:hypothetical protein